MGLQSVYYASNSKEKNNEVVLTPGKIYLWANITRDKRDFALE